MTEAQKSDLQAVRGSPFLRSLTVCGFGSYGRGATIEFGDVTTIIGDNDSGKSTLRRALECQFGLRAFSDADIYHGLGRAIIQLSVRSVTGEIITSRMVRNRSGRGLRTAADTLRRSTVLESYISHSEETVPVRLEDGERRRQLLEAMGLVCGGGGGDNQSADARIQRVWMEYMALAFSTPRGGSILDATGRERVALVIRSLPSGELFGLLDECRTAKTSLDKKIEQLVARRDGIRAKIAELKVRLERYRAGKIAYEAVLTCLKDKEQYLRRLEAYRGKLASLIDQVSRLPEPVPESRISALELSLSWFASIRPVLQCRDDVQAMCNLVEALDTDLGRLTVVDEMKHIAGIFSVLCKASTGVQDIIRIVDRLSVVHRSVIVAREREVQEVTELAVRRYRRMAHAFGVAATAILILAILVIVFILLR